MLLAGWAHSSEAEANFLRRVLDHVSECLVVVDTDGRVIFISAPYCRLLGGPPEDFLGRHITDVVSPKSRLHRVARGEIGGTLLKLDVRGHQLLARQVPVYEDERIVGAVGIALFSDMASLKNALAVAGEDRAIHGKGTPWVARYRLEDLVGKGPRMDAVRTAIERAAPTSWPVLVQGETGTGKELAANAIHTLSPRARGPFVWINCASLPESLIEAELFGYEGGAFTGARSAGKPGKFELASGGTLFLDEIGEMPPHLQASLLRAVQTQEIVRVGGVSPIRIDTRVVCATHRDLGERVAAGHFRADLYYRLDVLSVSMPALREREDLEYLIDQLLDAIARREGLPLRTIPRGVRAQLLAFEWPGNVRQLEAALLRFLVSGDPGLDAGAARPPPGAQPASSRSAASHRLRIHLERERDAYIRRCLEETAGDKDEAARRLGISRATLYRELRRMSAVGR